MKNIILDLMKQIALFYVYTSFIFVILIALDTNPFDWQENWDLNMIFILYTPISIMFKEFDFIFYFILLLYSFRGIIYNLRPSFNQGILLLFGGLSGAVVYSIFKLLYVFSIKYIGYQFLDTFYILGFILVGSIFFISKPIFKNEQKES